MKKDEMIKIIADKHKLILDENDPIFAVITANELLFDDFISKIDRYFIKQKADLETYKTNILAELRECAQTTKDSLKDITIQEITTEHKEIIVDKNQLSNSKIFLIVAVQIIFLLVGLIIGISI
ncbi:conjugal transfer protein TraM (plasmid) [Campylobacter fetus]|uniref:Conjugal transfer protein TraM n=1 Tax=Campylobacter fetus TaxID=196 RepID=A0A974RKQ5_CAMFE|nr:conjugal transfer protein TraM [Campylobacter fetus]OCS32717.1 conjugal transfer protein TraM [Campylobacter fetus subsp. venerealis]OCS40671.1 conjugal transfer protein TraM [Campylobacter fetus subsp. venerealis cfvi02/298]OCS19715.1 conjugal transfer protein TraM [Campylobacter fetus subsp. venerealis cfvi03/596]OCS22888.1 conjugal transfer protein TraM [Campylobacter fetus subsp. venerealis cfvi9825]QMS59860.1 conjugal transfer protein TraM [Campylobacter fetus]